MLETDHGSSKVYEYVRSNGRLTRASHDALLERKARYRGRHQETLAEKNSGAIDNRPRSLK